MTRKAQAQKERQKILIVDDLLQSAPSHVAQRFGIGIDTRLQLLPLAQ